MRDDRNKWRAPSAFSNKVTVGALTMAQQTLARQTLVSGVRVHAGAGVASQVVSWPNPAHGDSYAVGLRRDQVLMINGLSLPDGWDAQARQAVSDMTDGFVVYDLSGPRALQVLQRGADITDGVPSASALRRLFGLDVVLYRIGGPDRFRMHVERARAQALQEALESAMGFVGRKAD